MMRVKPLNLVNRLSALVISVAILLLGSSPAFAYNSSNLMDDGVFTDYGSMSESSIQNFLISKNSGLKNITDVETCDPIVQPYSYTYFPRCGQTVSAAGIIYDSAIAYRISPKVILATLQKEQSLVTTPNPTQSQINCAMGYNSCSGFVGFFKQVDNGTWQFRTYLELMNGRNWWGKVPSQYPCSDAKIPNDYYSTGLYPGRTVTFYNQGGAARTVTLANSATAGLYCYTPHVGPHSETGYSGSYNFVTSFEQWFGSVHDIYTWSPVGQYAYTDESKTSPVDLQNLVVGQKAYVGFQALNTGTATWSNTGFNPIRAATARPQDRISAFCSTSSSPAWIGCSRPANMIEASVAPGQTGTFEFWYNAPSYAGIYDEYFNLVAEGLKWMNDPGLYFHTITKPPTWSLLGQYAFTDNTKTTPIDLANLLPGQRVFIGFYAKNTSGTTWLNSASSSTPVRAGTTGPNDRISAFCDATWPACNRPATSNEPSIAPNGTATFEFWYKAPSTTGIYREHFKPVIDGLSWMNDTGMNFYTVVRFNTSDTTNRLDTNQSLNANQSIVSSDGRYKLVMQDDGNLVLYSINRALWSSRTNGTAANRVVMQSDGNLVVYDAQNKPYWASNTAGRGTSSLVVQVDGNLVIYDASNRPTWASNTHGQL